MNIRTMINKKRLRHIIDEAKPKKEESEPKVLTQDEILALVMALLEDKKNKGEEKTKIEKILELLVEKRDDEDKTEEEEGGTLK